MPKNALACSDKTFLSNLRDSDGRVPQPSTGSPENGFATRSSIVSSSALEVIAVEADYESLLVIHAMRLRPRYLGVYEGVRRCIK